LDVLGRFNQRLDARRDVSVVSILHRDTHDRAGLEIDGLTSPMTRAS